MRRSLRLVSRRPYRLLILGCLVPSCALGPMAEEPAAGDLTVLFIGSSYFAVNDMPGIVEGLATAAGKSIHVRRHVFSGNYLDYFAGNSATEDVIGEREWDAVILQGGCQNAAYPETHHLITPNSGYHPVYPALETLAAAIRANHAQTRVMYMMPWAFEDGMTWVAGQTDTYDDMQWRIRENALEWADSLDIELAPVGWAWREVLLADRPLHYLHLSDWNHPSPRGSYLAAAVVVATLFRESLEDVNYRPLLDETEAREFRAVASRVVLDSLDLWNVPEPSAAAGG